MRGKNVELRMRVTTIVNDKMVSFYSKNVMRHTIITETYIFI